jgi:hypothetical protein
LFSRTREEDLLIKLIPDDKAKSEIKTVDGPLLQAVKDCNKSDKTFYACSTRGIRLARRQIVFFLPSFRKED